jgi:hypothetical protein
VRSWRESNNWISFPSWIEDDFEILINVNSVSVCVTSKNLLMLGIRAERWSYLWFCRNFQTQESRKKMR